MERYSMLLKEANKFLANADHMTYTSYPLLNDPKLVVAIAENLHRAIVTAIDAFLHYEYLYKRVDIVPYEQNMKIDLFERHVIRNYKFDDEIIDYVKDLRGLIEFRKKSPLEFVRKDNFVILSENYSSKILNFKKIKEYLNNTKKFMIKVNGILT